MTNDWMLDVLADMRSFALMNGMHELAKQLDRAADIAKRDAPQAGEGGCGARQPPFGPRIRPQNPPSG